MRNNDGIQKYSPLWGEWTIEEPVGIGSYGKVYKISKQLGNEKVISAVKHIKIPTTAQYEDAMLSLGNNQETMNIYFKNIVNKFENEIKLLYKLRGNTNIVSYEDYMIKERDDIGWDIFIKMEYVTPLNKFIEVRSLTKEMIINLGIDMCSGLKLCHDNGIIHRDIKDSNIFISDNNSFKLGDFGVATNLSSEEAVTRIGTPYYMAPEIILNYNNESYDKTVDIYSLGIVLYRLFNRLKFPFMPVDDKDVTYNSKEIAQAKRVSGEELPKACDTDDKLWQVIKKACAHNPKERYSSVDDLKFDLMYLLRNMSDEEKKEVIIKPRGLSRNNPYFTKEDIEKYKEESQPEENNEYSVDLLEDTVLLEEVSENIVETMEDTELLEDEATLLLEDDDNTMLLEEDNTELLEDDSTIPLEEDNTVLLEDKNTILKEDKSTSKNNILIVGICCIVSYLLGIYITNLFL